MRAYKHHCLWAVVFLTLLVAQANSQTIVIRNLGCIRQENGVCQECATRYWLDEEAICQPVNPNCNTYDLRNGACLTCYPGFGLIEDTCLPGIVTSSFDPNCNTFKDGVCEKCSFGYYPGQEGLCTAADPSCRTFDPADGRCTSCFVGFEVSGRRCIRSQAQVAIPNCNQIQDGICTKCSFGYYFDAQRNCRQADPNCKSFSTILIQCTECYPGYELTADNSCLESEEPEGDPNCAEFDSDGVCQKCSFGSIFNSRRRCINVDPSCLTFDQQDGSCTSCYPGFEVRGRFCVKQEEGPNTNPFCAEWRQGVCVKCATGSYPGPSGICIGVDPNCRETQGGICLSCYNGYTLQNNACVKSVLEKTSDPLCAEWFEGICTRCSEGTFVGSEGICSLVDPLCKTYDPINGDCLSCYPGFSLEGVKCVESEEQEVIDPNCREFLTPEICSVCSDRYYIGVNGFCTEVNPLCRTYDEATGECTTCYSGFDLSFGGCIESASNVTDANCKQWDGDRCLNCSYGAYFGPNGKCLLADPLCRTFDPMNGKCTSCYSSFLLQQSGRCVKDENNQVTDAFCAQFFEGICTRCSLGYVFGSDGFCKQVSASCETFDSITGECMSCFLGFYLEDGKCLEGEGGEAMDPYCTSFVAGVCVKCSRNFFFGNNGLCEAVDPLCKTYDPIDGACLSCYQSYILQGIKCIEDVNGTTTDPNCASWLEGICISCAPRTFIGSNGLCKQVSIDCNTYDQISGFCTSCYAGFEVFQGGCRVSASPNSCSEIDEQGRCTKCGAGSYLRNGICLQIDTQCAFFDTEKQECMACYDGYSILNGVCQISKVEEALQVQNCFAYSESSQCIKCYDRFYLSSNVCQPVDVFCKTYDQFTGNCLSCYTTFKLVNARCIQ